MLRSTNMNTGSRHISLIGVRNGDEGKGGRAIHYIRRAAERSRSMDDKLHVMVYRWHGGANAGHTAVVNNTTFKLHQIPAGVLIPGAYSLQGAGIYLNPRKQVEEMNTLRNQGIEITPRNLGIASNAFMTLDFHVEEDKPNLEKAEHTSTANGIMQTARDKYARVGIRFAEFLDPAEFADALRKTTFRDNIFRSGTIDSIVEGYAAEREALAPFMVLENDVWKNAEFRYRIGEGANGGGIDIQEGYYPGVTSSHPAQVVRRPDLVIGVMKLYDSSVGHGRPFVGRLEDRGLESELRELWKERGTTTGKDRYIGWLDLVAAKHIIDTAGVDYLIGNCGDRLQDLATRGGKVGLVTGYKVNGKTYTEWDPSFHKRNTLYEATPVVEMFDAWTRFSKDGDISGGAQRFLDRIQKAVNREFVLLGTGPCEKDVIEIKNAFNLSRVAH